MSWRLPESGPILWHAFPDGLVVFNAHRKTTHYLPDAAKAVFGVACTPPTGVHCLPEFHQAVTEALPDAKPTKADILAILEALERQGLLEKA